MAKEIPSVERVKAELVKAGVSADVQATVDKILSEKMTLEEQWAHRNIFVGLQPALSSLFETARLQWAVVVLNYVRSEFVVQQIAQAKELAFELSALECEKAKDLTEAATAIRALKAPPI